MATLVQPASDVRPLPLILRLEAVTELSDDQFYELCRRNRDLRIERTAKGDLIIMSPAGGRSGNRSAHILFQLQRWAREDGTGVAFDSSTGFVLPNGAIRAPDVSWVRRTRLAALSSEQKEKFLPLAPDFVAELRSPSDSPAALAEKLQEYVSNGTALGLLIDPYEKRVTSLRTGQPAETLIAPSLVACDPVLSGFVLDLSEIWEVGW